MRKYKEVEFDDSALYEGISPVMSNDDSRSYLVKLTKQQISSHQCDETKSDFKATMKQVVDNVVMGQALTIVDASEYSPETDIDWIIRVFRDLGYNVKIDNSDHIMLYIAVN